MTDANDRAVRQWKNRCWFHPIISCNVSTGRWVDPNVSNYHDLGPKSKSIHGFQHLQHCNIACSNVVCLRHIKCSCYTFQHSMAIMAIYADEFSEI